MQQDQTNSDDLSVFNAPYKKINKTQTSNPSFFPEFHRFAINSIFTSQDFLSNIHSIHHHSVIFLDELNTSPDSTIIEYFISLQQFKDRFRFIAAINPFESSAEIDSLPQVLSLIGLKQMKSTSEEDSIDFSHIKYHVYPSLPNVKPYSLLFYSENQDLQSILESEKKLIFESLQYQIFYQFSSLDQIHHKIIDNFPEHFTNCFYFLRDITYNQGRTSLRDTKKAIQQLLAFQSLSFGIKEIELMKLVLFNLFGLSLNDGLPPVQNKNKQKILIKNILNTSKINLKIFKNKHSINFYLRKNENLHLLNILNFFYQKKIPQ
jgi:hypothetical protein